MRIRISLGAFLLGSTLLVVNSAQAAVSCHVINAKGVGQDLGGGNTTANIIGGGLLQGTTTASFAPTGLTGSVLSFAGTVTFTTKENGTLTVAITGGIDVATGQFTATGPIVSATDKLSGATGNLSFAGVENLSTGAFTEDISGMICVDLAP